MRSGDEAERAREEGATGGGPAGLEQIRADQEHLRQLRRERQSRVIKVIVALAIIALLIVFILSNSQPKEVNFVFFTKEIRLIWVMFVSVLLGGIAGYLIGRPGKQIRFHSRHEEGEKKG